MAWQRWVEIVVMGLSAGSFGIAFCIAISAVVQGYRKTKSLRSIQKWESKPIVPIDAAHKAELEKVWVLWRARWSGYATEINLMANPIRRDAIEIVKEASNWGRLGVQYVLIGNGGALAALPYLLSSPTAKYAIGIGDAFWSAVWFAGGLTAAAACCVVAYLDFQVTAAMYWANHQIEIRAAQIRHFETADTLPLEAHTEMLGVLQSVTTRTSLAGVWIAFIAWFALAWGAFRLIISMAA